MSRIFHDRERWLLQALIPSLQCIRMVVKIFPWRIMVPAGVFVVASEDENDTHSWPRGLLLSALCTFALRSVLPVLSAWESAIVQGASDMIL